METPDKGKVGPVLNPGAEDSPVFNFISNLSPILSVHPKGTRQSGQFFQQLDYGSISSIFASPQIGSNSIRNASSEIYNGTCHDVESVEANNNPACSLGENVLMRQTEIVSEKNSIKYSLTEVVDDVPDYSLNTNIVPRPNVGSPASKLMPCRKKKANPKLALLEAKVELSSEVCLPRVDQWSTDAMRNLGFLDSSNGCAVQLDFQDVLNSDTSFHKQPEALAHPVQNLPDLAAMCAEQDCNQQMITGGIQSKLVPSEKLRCGTSEFTEAQPMDDEVLSSQQYGFRRRCLVFESCRVPKCESNSGHNNQVKPSARSPACMLRGIGLHLNALAISTGDSTTLKGHSSGGKAENADPQTSNTEQQSELHPFSTGNYAFAGEDVDQVDDSLALVPVDLDVRPDSPKRKRRKFENGDGDACKRCSCKKSKCLKLYCECFAAGVYCSEPCACRECQNKPIHEEIVLATRKQIESRNPLAFAPKVIRASEISLENGEDSNSTPASARHKRGCNCKRSNCLKRYCECYQGGAGCSKSCRCESCKNVFGIRDGSSPANTEEVEEKTDALQQEQHVPVQNDEHHLLSETGNPYFEDMIIRDDTLDILKEDVSPYIIGVKNASPNRKRISPPKRAVGLSPICKAGRKLILKSISPFPSLVDEHETGSSTNPTAL